ncbi:putative ATP-grasp-modified RiPP [Streptosporangium subroseum]|uniref:putative ATP-grasp-modified RiPP n=1 Tax=Streptosporangium subroseum TaxID=106412 RepID=UPI00342360E9
MTDAVPWGLSRMTERLPATPPLYETAQLDAMTQIADFYDASGTLVEMMGKHGTNKTSSTASKSGGGGGDGGGPKPEVTDDSSTDYVPD